MILFELAKDDVQKGYVKLLDKKRWYYIDKHGKALRHAKIVFKTHSLQNKLVKEWVYHDPTKAQDKCIEVLLGRIRRKWYAISTLRKLSPVCVINHYDTYKRVPKKVLITAVKYTDALDDEQKQKLLRIFNRMKTEVSKKPDKREIPIFINSEKDLKKLEPKRKKEK